MVVTGFPYAYATNSSLQRESDAREGDCRLALRRNGERGLGGLTRLHLAEVDAHWRNSERSGDLTDAGRHVQPLITSKMSAESASRIGRLLLVIHEEWGNG